MAHGLFVKLDPRFIFQRKAVKVGPFGRLLYISALGYCVESLSDGFIPEKVVARLADIDDPDVTASLTALVTNNLFEKVTGGYQIHDYLEWQTAAASVEKKREAGKLRQQKYRERRQGDGVTNTSPRRVSDKSRARARAREECNSGEPAKTTSQFTPPSLDEVTGYCRERNNHVKPQKFIDFYSSKGWMVGKNRMSDWKAAVRGWEDDNGRAPPAEHPVAAAADRNAEYLDQVFKGR
jgi:hypothetical protein